MIFRILEEKIYGEGYSKNKKESLMERERESARQREGVGEGELERG